MQDSIYLVWALNRFVRGLIKVVFVYPLMLVTCVPTFIFDRLCALNARLDNWWWA